MEKTLSGVPVSKGFPIVNPIKEDYEEIHTIDTYVLLCMVSSLNKRNMGHQLVIIGFPGIYKEEVEGGTLLEMVTMNDHLKNLEPMIDPKEKECQKISISRQIESTGKDGNG